MANTKVQYIGDASTDTFAITFPYIKRGDVHVYVNRIKLLPTQYAFLTDSSIQILNTPAQDDVIDIERHTEVDVRLVDFQNGAILTEQEMDLDSTQAFYLIQENQENYANLINDALTAIAVANGLVITDPETIMDQLVQDMIASAAASTLQQRITDIDNNAQAILNNTTSLVQGDQNLQSQINALAGSVAATVFVQPNEPVPGVGGVPDPIPDSARWYDSDDNNHPYIYDQAQLLWLDLEDPRIGANAAAITALQSSLATTDGNVAANASAIGVLDTTVTNINGVVTGHTSDITQLQTDIATANGNIAGNASAISSLDTRVTTAEGNITTNASDISALEATVNDPSTGVAANATGLSSLSTTVSQQGTDIGNNAANISANAGAITALQSTINLRNRTFAQDTAPTASNIGDLWIDTDGDNRLHRWNGTAWVNVRDAVISANATAISTLNTNVANNASGISANSSLITALDSRLTTAEGDIVNATVSINANTTAISNANGDISALEARYGVSLNVNGYITGFVQNNDGTTGEFVILADKFKIVDPSGDPGETEFVPFSVAGGVVSMQNVSISGNLVVDGTINGAKIGLSSGLSEIDANLGAITAGNITLNTTGFIRGGQTAYNTGSGFFLGYDTADYKFSIGNSATGNSLTWDGTTLRVEGELIVGEYIVSDNVILSAPTLRSKFGPFGSEVKMKEFLIEKPGTVRVKFDAWRSSGAGVTQIPYVQVRRNNVTQQTVNVSNTSTVAYTRDVSVSAGDKIQLYGQGGERFDGSEFLELTLNLDDAEIRADIQLSVGGSVLLD